MNSLVNYDSDDENDKYEDTSLPVKSHQTANQRKDDDTNYDDVTMDMSEDSEDNERPHGLPTSLRQHERERGSDERRKNKDYSCARDSQDRNWKSRSSSTERQADKKRDMRKDDCYDKKDIKDDHYDRKDARDDCHDRKDVRLDKKDTKDDRYDKKDDRLDRKDVKGERFDRKDYRYDRKDERRDGKDYRNDKYQRKEKKEYRHEKDDASDKDKHRTDRHKGDSRRSPGERRPDRKGLLGPRDSVKSTGPPSLMDVKPYEDHASISDESRRERDRYRDRERGRSRDYNERSSYRGRSRSREKSRGSSMEVHESSDMNSKVSYKVSRKLQVMEKMGLQIKTPDGSMTTAQELRAGSTSTNSALASQLPAYYNPNAVNAARIIDQMHKRKLLWGNKSKSQQQQQQSEASSAEAKPAVVAPPAAAQWTGAKFSDGKQVDKFMRLMGIKDPEAIAKAEVKKSEEEDVNKKQQEMFEAMQAQYEVARATTHTMRGVGLGFQRHL